jgi:hypothetical protein
MIFRTASPIGCSNTNKPNTTSMKSIISKSIVVAFASAAILASQATAQITNIPDANSGITGSLKVAAAKVFTSGGSLATTAFQSPATISAVVVQEGETTAVTNSKGVTWTTKQAKYAVANKDILTAAGITNKGWSLAFTNLLGTEPLTVNKLVAVNTSTGDFDSATTNVVRTSTFFGLYTAGTYAENTNGDTVTDKYTGVGTTAGVFNGVADFAASGPLTYDGNAKLVATIGTLKSTNYYTSETLNGTINTTYEK